MTENSPARLPEVLLDAITFGLYFDIRPYSPSIFEAFRTNLQHLITTGTDGHRLILDVPIGEEGELGQASVELVYSSHLGCFHSMSSVRMNGMRMLRQSLFGSQLDSLSLDGSDNFIGAITHPVEELLGQQIALAAQALNTVATVLDGALPAGYSSENASCWLKSAESCLDLEVRNATSVVQSLQRSALTGRVRTHTDWYRSSSEERDGCITIRHWRQQNGPCFKLYAKDEGLLRVEVSCTNRKAMRMVSCVGREQYVDSEAAENLLLSFAKTVEPLLQELRAHALDAAGDAASVDDLLLALSPLLDMRRERGGTRGRPVQHASIRAASEAIEALFTSGAFTATGWRPGHAVRRVLDSLSEPTGPLARSGHRAIYSVRPRFARAANTVATRA